MIRFLGAKRLPLYLAAIAVILSGPSLFIGFYQDDYVARYIYSDLEGASDLYRAYAGGYGISNGVVADNHWQVEAGHAPWWTYPNLRLALFRPVSQATHMLDVALDSSSAPLMHAHNLLWIAFLVVAMTLLYRTTMGAVVGGFAALLFAFDHTHGFTVGYIANRHALISATFGSLCLWQHIRFRMHGDKLAGLVAPVLYVIALLCGELSVAVVGYIFAYTVFVETGPLLRRSLAFAPYLFITVIWRAVYNWAGYGVEGSGVYIDAGRESLRFLSALAERGPILLLGQFAAPPADIVYLIDAKAVRALAVGAAIFCVALGAAFVPLFAKNRTARFWAAGLLISIVPAATTFPHNRQLIFTSFGAMALLAQFAEMYAARGAAALSRGARLVAIPGGIVLFGHLFIAPLAMPLATCSVALAKTFHRQVDKVEDDISGRVAVFVTSPDYLAVRLVQLIRRVEGRPLARKWRGLSFGPQAVVVRRPDERTLVLDYEGGILTTSLSELYRDRRLRMAPGQRVELEGLSVTVRGVTDDGRAKSAEFSFDRALDDPEYRFYYWGREGFARFTLPPVGGSVAVPGPVVSI